MTACRKIFAALVSWKKNIVWIEKKPEQWIFLNMHYQELLIMSEASSCREC